MPSFKTIEVPSWVEARILTFLNRANSVSDITDDPELVDNPDNGVDGSTIGATVAQRLLDRRGRLPWRRYTRVAELEGIAGFGEDKFRDLVYSFGKPAADAFRQMMFGGVIHNNWQLEPITEQYSDHKNFEAVVNNESAFRQRVSYLMRSAWIGDGMDAQLAEAKRMLLYQSYLETFDIEHYGAIEFAFFFYQFDADNWFSFDRVREVCERYLSYYSNWQYRQELRMFKGFNKVGTQSTSTTQGTLPVVVNYGERAITIWRVQLFD